MALLKHQLQQSIAHWLEPSLLSKDKLQFIVYVGHPVIMLDITPWVDTATLTTQL